MKKPKVKVISKPIEAECWQCNGNGCKVCDNTGIWKESNYLLIAENPKGQKIAFQMDTIK
jgi:hypothetical protein